MTLKDDDFERLLAGRLSGYDNVKDVMHLVNKPTAKRGAPRIEDRRNTFEAKKPWLLKGMSRRTWYRRRAEEKANEDKGA